MSDDDDVRLQWTTTMMMGDIDDECGSGDANAG